VVAVTKIGAVLEELQAHGELFSEFPGRFVVATNDVDSFANRATAAGVPVALLGTCGGGALVIGSTINLSAEEIVARREGALIDALDVAG
jgi:hypothetical protein